MSDMSIGDLSRYMSPTVLYTSIH